MELPLKSSKTGNLQNFDGQQMMYLKEKRRRLFFVNITASKPLTFIAAWPNFSFVINEVALYIAKKKSRFPLALYTFQLILRHFKFRTDL